MIKNEDETEIDPREVLASLDDGDVSSAENTVDTEQPSIPVAAHTESPSLADVIRKQATEDERPHSKNFTLRKILGGEILDTSILRKQLWIFVIVTIFIVLYITNRYSCQQYLIEIDAKNVELKDIKYRALSSSSMLTEMSRESRVIDKLKHNKDSILHISKQPPYIIKIPAQ